MRDRGEFLEWAVVFDNYYGTPRKPVEQALAAGRDVLFDVDWQGAAELARRGARTMSSRCSFCRRHGDGARAAPQ